MQCTLLYRILCYSVRRHMEISVSILEYFNHIQIKFCGCSTRVEKTCSSTTRLVEHLEQHIQAGGTITVAYTGPWNTYVQQDMEAGGTCTLTGVYIGLGNPQSGTYRLVQQHIKTSETLKAPQLGCLSIQCCTSKLLYHLQQHNQVFETPTATQQGCWNICNSIRKLIIHLQKHYSHGEKSTAIKLGMWNTLKVY